MLLLLSGAVITRPLKSDSWSLTVGRAQRSGQWEEGQVIEWYCPFCLLTPRQKNWLLILLKQYFTSNGWMGYFFPLPNLLVQWFLILAVHPNPLGPDTKQRLLGLDLKIFFSKFKVEPRMRHVLKTSLGDSDEQPSLETFTAVCSEARSICFAFIAPWIK